MTGSATNTKTSAMMQGLQVIDCDTHYTEPPDLWTSRAPSAYRERVPHLKTLNGESRWFVEGDRDFGTVGITVIGENHRKTYGRLTLASFEELDRAAYDVKARLALMNELG